MSNILKSRHWPVAAISPVQVTRGTTHTLKAQCMTMHYVMQLALESEGKNVAAVIPLPE
jgi:hypothetical protein